MKMKIFKIFILPVILLLNTQLLLSQSWYQIPSPTTNTFNGLFIIVNSIYSYGNSGSLFLKNDAAITWTNRSVPFPINIKGMATSTGTFVVGESGKVYVSSNYGISWSQFLSTFNPSSNPTFNINSIWTEEGGSFYIVGDGGNFAHCRNIGEGTMDYLHPPTGTTQRLNSLWGGFVTTGVGSILAVGDNGTILKSTYPYTSISARSSGTTENLYCIAKGGDVTGTQFAIAVGANGTILKSTDAGETWTHSVSHTSNDLYCVNYLVGGYGFACGANGTILRDSSSFGSTNNRGVNWIQQTSHTAESLNGIEQFYGNEAYAVGNGGIINRTTTGGTSFISKINSLAPSFQLEQNYPNPFNPATNIKFSVPKSGIVKLIVYDILGKEIQTLVNERLSEGTYNVDFAGGNLPSGVYFYKIDSQDFTDVKKMSLIK